MTQIEGGPSGPQPDPARAVQPRRPRAAATLGAGGLTLAGLLFALAGGSPSVAHAGPGTPPPAPLSDDDLNRVVQRYCAACHNDVARTGNLTLRGFDVAHPEAQAEIAEKVIAKLRAGMMPPPGARAPGGDSLETLVQRIEDRMDDAARTLPNPGSRSFQRLNRAEYERSILDLLDLEIDAGAWLPLDTRSANFDNIADAQLLSPTLLDGYLKAASEVSRMALGDPSAPSVEHTYTNSGYLSQMARIPGAPFGTRGGISVIHTFPADGEYVLRAVFEHTTTGEGYFGQIARGEQLEFSVNGERVALLEVDPWLQGSDPDGISMRTAPVPIRAGPQRITAAFVQRADGPVDDLLSPHEWSLADRHTGIGGYGLTLLPHVRDLGIVGPTRVTGMSETPSRRRVLTCTPSSVPEGPACARAILTSLAERAYRRPVEERDIESLLSFHARGAAAGDFEAGIRLALQALLASPHFVFRVETAPEGVRPGESYPLSGLALASRLSFFLWGSPPDAQLLQAARTGELDSPAGLEREARRLLDDPRSESLATRFAGQWLRLQDLDRVHPDAYWFPDFDQQLREAMRRETELLFLHLVREDRSFFELYDADYSFLNARLARHYGIDGVLGDHFRRVAIPEPERQGILGHGSVLVSTSMANRTSPVLRGKWVMEVLMGTPPPPPPPGVPDLEETEGAHSGRMLTTRERMEIHRANPACTSCHTFMDPIGLALENFDVTGRWRIRENGVGLDTRGDYYDGTPISTPIELRQALLARPTPLVRTFTTNLMAYALGRRVEAHDQPTIRAIVRNAETRNHRMSAFVMGVILSDAFRMQREGSAADLDAGAAGSGGV